MVDEPARVAGRDEPPEADDTPEVDRASDAEAAPPTVLGTTVRGTNARGRAAEEAAESATARRPPQRHRAPSRRRSTATPAREDGRARDDNHGSDDARADDGRAHDATGPPGDGRPADGIRRIGRAAPSDGFDASERSTRTGRAAAADIDPTRDGGAAQRDSPQIRSESTDDGPNWLDQEAGPVVRPYTVTGGRARAATGTLDLLSYVEALYAPDADVVHLQPEHRGILSLTRTALSLAEIAAHLDLPVGVVRVLIGDLVQANLVSTFSSSTPVTPPDESILQAVIDGLRAL